MNEQRIVYTRPDGGVSVIIPTGEVGIDELMSKVVPSDATGARKCTTTDLPDRVFRDAWDDSNPEDFVGVNLDKAKEVAHGKRRAVRAEKFAPLDIQATIPAQATQAESDRKKIRDADAIVQDSIDMALDECTLRAIMTDDNLL